MARLPPVAPRPTLLCADARRLAASAVVLLAMAPALHAQGACPDPSAKVVNCGHRGTGSSHPGDAYPENTLASFAQAVAEGAQMIELDVQHSSDGALVVLHDSTVDRTTDGTGCIGDLTLAELRTLDAAKGTLLEGTGVGLPTLQEVLAAVEVDVNVEIKGTAPGGPCPASDNPRLAADVVEAITAGSQPGRRIVISSFELDALDEARRLDASLYLGYLSFARADLDVAAAHGLDALNLFNASLGDDTIALAHQAGLELNLWTVNDPGEMALLLDAGADLIITDEPQLLAALLAERLASASCPDGGTGADAGVGDPTSSAAGCSLSGLSDPHPAPPGRLSLAWMVLALMALAWRSAARRWRRRP